MNIGIDITSLIYQRGVSRYTSNLVQALINYTPHQLSLYGYSFSQNSLLQKLAKQLIATHPHKHSAKIQSIPPTLQEKLWQLGLNKVKTHLPAINIFHSWDWLQPPDKNTPLVSTIHDLAILKFPETAHPKILKTHQRSWKILRQRRAHLIAVSHSTKRDIVELLEYPNWLIHVVPEALPVEIERLDQNMDEQELERIKYQLNLDRPYILFVGVREPRKNLDRLIQAWEPLSAKIDLVVAGDKGWGELKLHKNKRLKFLGRVSDRQLSALYAEAEIFAYPSLYEGFGLPILEAFHHGTPVITSDISSMIEVAGNAAELVNPDSVEEIRQAIKTILSESPEQQQKRLQRMIIRKQMFSWCKVAEQTVTVYKKAIQDFKEQHDT